jgi:hypothetical protein
MDVEKTIAFLLENQARCLAAFQAKFEAGMEEIQQNQAATERLISAFAKAGQAQIELHRGRLDGLEGRLEANHKPLEAQERSSRPSWIALTPFCEARATATTSRRSLWNLK